MPSRCTDCGREANLTVTQDGESRVLCDRCVDRFVASPGFSYFVHAFQRPRLVADECPHCRTTRASIVETGITGCSLCFEAFPKALAGFGIEKGSWTKLS